MKCIAVIKEQTYYKGLKTHGLEPRWRMAKVTGLDAGVSFLHLHTDDWGSIPKSCQRLVLASSRGAAKLAHCSEGGGRTQQGLVISPHTTAPPGRFGISHR